MGGQRLLDLHRLQTDTTDLDLLIDPAQVDQPLGILQADQVTRSGTNARPSHSTKGLSTPASLEASVAISVAVSVGAPAPSPSASVR